MPRQHVTVTLLGEIRGLGSKLATWLQIWGKSAKGSLETASLHMGAPAQAERARVLREKQLNLRVKSHCTSDANAQVSLYSI